MVPLKLIPVLAAVVVGVVGGVILYFKKPDSFHRPNYGSGQCNGETKRKDPRQCSICLKQMNSYESVTLPCGDIFCEKCIMSLLSGTQTTCPECRVEISPEVRERLRSN